MTKLIGTGPNQVPSNADLGTMAYQDYSEVAPILKGGRRNFMYNGDMRIAQRGTSFSSPQNYTLDRYKSLRYAAGDYTVSQQTAGLEQFQYCLRAQRNSGNSQNNSFAVNQPLEVNDSYALRGQFVTFSLYLRAGSDYSCADTTIRVGIHFASGEYGVNYSNFTVATTFPINASVDLRGQTDWVKYTYTGYIPTNAVQVNCSIQPQGFSGTAGSNDYVETTGWQLELGKVATPFEHRSYGEELALCQRYYQILFVNSNSRWQGRIGSVYNASRVFVTVDLPTTMRTTPTVVLSTSPAFSWSIYSANGSIGPSTAISNTYPTINSIGFDVYPSGGNLASGYFGNAVHMDVATGYAHAQAEL